MNTLEKLTSITTPADSIPKGPVQTASQTLPFGELSWENFERLCYRLAVEGSEVEHCDRYGRAGQGQQGIDLFVRKINGKYDTWQAKRYEQYSVANLKSAIKAFLNGNWVNKTETFYIATQAHLSDTKLQDEIEKQAILLKNKGILLVVLGGDRLSKELRKYPKLVLDFFGRSWAKAFLGEGINENLLQLLDGEEVAKLRSQLASLYHTQFHLLDRGAIESSDARYNSQSNQGEGILNRFTRPDIICRELRGTATSKAVSKSENNHNQELDKNKKLANIEVERSRRIPLAGWITQSNHLALLGDAGTGKSTLLRSIALDLIGAQLVFPEISSRWSNSIPIFVSFAKWVRMAESNEKIGLKEVVRASLQPILTTPDIGGFLDRAIDEGRILLLVDGLDEWSNEQAARTALLSILTLVGTHQIPAIVTARPRGLTKIGAIPPNWSTGTLAPLSQEQQRLMVFRCLGINETYADTETENANRQLQQVADRFFKELKRESGLSTLSEIPLLLVSLLALAIRRITLPRDRVRALDQLIDVLLEIHPQSRATAAGDIKARFVAAEDLEVRKDAIAALAYATRAEGRDAGYPVIEAKEKIRTFLTKPDTHAFTPERAKQAANEILAVNSETVGLLIEKGPDEIGFVHASLEEFLTAIHIQGWDLQKLVLFISENATNPRWRNVIANLIAVTKRTTEIDQFIDAIESVKTDFLGESAKRQLLTDITFSHSKMSPVQGIKLAQNSINFIEQPCYIKERIEILTSALNGTHHPVLGKLLLERINIWSPKTIEFNSNLFEVLGKWDEAEDLLLALQRGISGESRWSRRAAARAIAEVYAGNENVHQWLFNLLNGAVDLETTCAVVEALILGWQSSTEINQIIADLTQSDSINLRLMGIWANTKLQRNIEAHLHELLEILMESGELDYRYLELGSEALINGWDNHPTVINKCIQSLRSGFRLEKKLDQDTSINYLLSCKPENETVREWIIEEFNHPHPFISLHMHGLNRLITFAKVDNKIKESFIQMIIKNNILDYQLAGVISELKDSRLKNFAIEKVRGTDDSWSYPWMLRELLNGWPTDLDVNILINEIRQWPDEKLRNLAPLLPQIITNHTECRSKLLTLIRPDGSHLFRSLATTFSSIGCNESDQEVVNELLRVARTNLLWGGKEDLIRLFGGNPLVQKFASELLLERDPPIAAIAEAYQKVKNIRVKTLDHIGSLPISLRYVLSEAASIDCDSHISMENLLKQYDSEIDADLKVLNSIYYHEFLNSSNIDLTETIKRLLTDAKATGPDFEDRRAAAVAGLITLKSMNEFNKLLDNNKPLEISTGKFNEKSSTILGLIARKWSELKSELGGELINRIDRGSSTSSTWELLAPYVSWNADLRQDFLNYCALTDGSLNNQCLRALARERLNSNLLEHHCIHAITEKSSNGFSPWERMSRQYEATFILREYIPAKPNIKNSFVETYNQRKDLNSLSMLALYDPENELLKSLSISPIHIGNNHHNWTAACTLSAAVQNSAEFIEILRAMINREEHNIWCFQVYTNIVVIERLARDPDAVMILLSLLDSKLSNSEIASIPRYLAAVGPLKTETYLKLRQILNSSGNRKGVPIAGYDAIADDIRPISHSLLDALS